MGLLTGVHCDKKDLPDVSISRSKSGHFHTASNILVPAQLFWYLSGVSPHILGGVAWWGRLCEHIPQNIRGKFGQRKRVLAGDLFSGRLVSYCDCRASSSSTTQLD